MHAQRPEYDPGELYRNADEFIRQCYAELDREDEIGPRLAEIEDEIHERGHYEHTADELEHGARMAWRNSNRCIGRLLWNTLRVRDARDAETAAEVHDELCRHIEFATNGGKIRPAITLFEPAVRGQEQVRLWNYQLIRYAGYETPDGVLGDPDSLAMTEYCERRGWEAAGTDFDILPLVIQAGDGPPEVFEIPDDIVLEVPLSHPEYDWFADLDLRWYGVPIVSNMRLEIGGIQYTAAPFNGWYMETEIGARNLADEDRYDMVPEVGERMDLDTSRDRSLWQDEAIVQLNRAVLHSYEEAGVKIVDHHTAAEQFEEFERQEESADREVTGDWKWLIPPVSPASTHVFHSSYDDTVNSPNFFYQDSPLEAE